MGCVTPACQPCVFWWPPLNVNTVEGWVGTPVTSLKKYLVMTTRCKQQASGLMSGQERRGYVRQVCCLGVGVDPKL